MHYRQNQVSRVGYSVTAFTRLINASLILVFANAHAQVEALFDTKIPTQSMVMAKARPKSSADMVSEQQSGLQQNTGDKQLQDASFLPARVSYNAQRVYHWVGQASLRLLSYSGRHLSRDKQEAARYFSIQVWPKLEQALFFVAKAPLIDVQKLHADSRALLMDAPKLIATQDGQWRFKVPVMLLVYAPKAVHKKLVEVQLSVAVDPEKSESFLVTAASVHELIDAGT